jgi:hypothetical protein
MVQRVPHEPTSSNSAWPSPDAQHSLSALDLLLRSNGPVAHSGPGAPRDIRDPAYVFRPVREPALFAPRGDP